MPQYRTVDVALEHGEVRVLLVAIRYFLECHSVTAYEYGVEYQEQSKSPEAQADLKDNILYWPETYAGNGRFETWPDPDTTPCPELHRNLARLGRAYHTLARLLVGVRTELLDNDGPTYCLPEMVTDLLGYGELEDFGLIEPETFSQEDPAEIKERLRKKFLAAFGPRKLPYTAEVDGFTGP